jgi:predicted glutamine amidotransferase
MCGIVGIQFDNSANSSEFFYSWIKKCLLISSRRGQDSCGVCIVLECKGNITLKIFKSENGPKQTLKDSSIYNFIKDSIKNKCKILFISAHTRLATNGDTSNLNNQPLINNSENAALIFNGIICNSKKIVKEKKLITKTSNDGEALWLLDHNNLSINNIKGNFSFIKIHGDNETLISYMTNNGSLYESNQNIYGITKIILSERSFFYKLGIKKIKKNEINRKYQIKLSNKKINIINLKNIILNNTEIVKTIDIKKTTLNNKIINEVEQRINEVQSIIIRCNKCILPNTHPFITFDENGICNFCNNYKKKKLTPKEILINELNKYKRKFGDQSILCALSGGRDSSYAAHLLVKELNIKPITYTYDWGLNTNLARRNVSIMSGALGLENIIIAADIRKKRNNIKKNILAWLKKPHLGIVPLFMAGDKQFISNANILKKELDIKIEIFASNSFETTQFKEEFSGFKLWENDNTHNPTKMKITSQIKLIYFYLSQFISNTKYINNSLLDTLTGFFNYYYNTSRKAEIYDFFDWDEKKINKTLISEYGWETANDTSSTWRIGDGTQSFYNFIYYIFAGFTENDTLRSFLIRENKMKRNEALEMIKKENYPRFPTIEWYCSLFDLKISEIILSILKHAKSYDEINYNHYRIL